MSAAEDYEAGRLKEALRAATDEVKAKPADVSRRLFLSELLLFSGELDRADKQLDAVSQQDTKQAVGVALLRQLLRAETARRQFYSEGRLPEFLTQPTPELRLRLEASIRVREGNLKEAARLLGEAEAKRPRVQGTLDGQAFDDFRDLDDLTASFLEVLTSNGKYYWIPIESLELVEFLPCTRAHDLFWRGTHMILRGGPDGVVYLPTLYNGSEVSGDEKVRLGRATDWAGGDGSPIRGVGQRMYLAGDRDVSILELKRLEITGAAGGQA